MVIIVVLQFILVTFAGRAFGVYSNYGLTPQQWGISILIGSFGMVNNLFLKLLPIAKHEHEHPDKGFGNKLADVRKGSKIISLKRIEERVDRDLAKNHVLG
jgi:hypothetical protein